MRVRRGPQIDTTILGATSLLAIAMGSNGGAPVKVGAPPVRTEPLKSPAVIGQWRSGDGSVALELERDGTYELTVDGRDRAAHGSYVLDGDDLRLRDDDGLRTPGRLVDGLIEMAGHELFPA